jgi:hypothetical protein
VRATIAGVSVNGWRIANPISCVEFDAASKHHRIRFVTRLKAAGVTASTVRDE